MHILPERCAFEITDSRDFGYAAARDTRCKSSASQEYQLGTQEVRSMGFVYFPHDRVAVRMRCARGWVGGEVQRQVGLDFYEVCLQGHDTERALLVRSTELLPIRANETMPDCRSCAKACDEWAGALEPHLSGCALV